MSLMVEEIIVLSSATLMDAEQKMDVRILHAFLLPSHVSPGGADNHVTIIGMGSHSTRSSAVFGAKSARPTINV